MQKIFIAVITVFFLIVNTACVAGDFLKSVQNTSSKNQKTLLIFYRPDCPYCANMDRSITADPAFQKQLTGNYNVQVFDITSQEGRLMADKFNVHAVPTIVQYNNATGETQLTKGFGGIEKLSRQLQLNISASNNKSAQLITRTPAVCGDGLVEGTEACDDGNTTNGDGCNAVCAVEAGYNCTGSPSTCTVAAVCGNGIIEGAEACDDGNTVNGDGCSATCTLEAPLNDNCTGAFAIGGVSGSLTGNNGMATSSAIATASCGLPTRDVWYSFTLAGVKNYRININGTGMADPIVVLYSGTCGALVQQACNDDIVNGNPFSQIQGTLAAGTYYVRVGSYSTTTGGSFSLVYNFNMPNVCGNGVIESTEECDDGNIATGDGCNNNCKIENGALINGVSINNDSTRANPSAMLEVKSFDKGLLIPRMNSTQRAAIASPAKGLMVFDITSNTFWYHNGTTWTEIGGSSGTTGSGLPAGTASQTLRNNGTSWLANSALQNDGTNVTVTGQLKINGGAPAAGKVLTSDATGTGSWTTPSYEVSTNSGFSVGNSFSQPFSTAFVPVVNSESFDDGNNVVNGVFTAPAAGVYSFNANASFSFSNITSQSTIQLVLESPTSTFYGTQTQLFPTAFTGVADMQVSTIVKLVAGAQIRLSVNVYGTSGVQNLTRMSFRGVRVY